MHLDSNQGQIDPVLPMPLASQSRPALVKPELLERLQAWCLDPPEAKVGFAQKLAQEKGWSAPYATRVVAEYRRFLYLAVTASHPVCPSNPVDQAWHQHLLETRSYWGEFCPKVLGEPLHHTPSRGGTEEQQRMREWYGRTLASYQAAFGTAPPLDLWPPTHLRFGGAEREKQVDAGRLWLLPRPRLFDLHRRKQRGGLAPWLEQGGLLAVLALGVSGCGAKALPFPYSLSGPEFMLLYGLLTGVKLLVVLALSGWKDETRARLFGGLAIGAVWVLGSCSRISGSEGEGDRVASAGRGPAGDRGGSGGGSDAGAGGCGGGGCGGCGGGGGCGG